MKEETNSKTGVAPRDKSAGFPPSTSKGPSTFRLLIALTGSILVAEILVMMLLSVLPSLSLHAAIALDALLLGIVSFPALYFFMFRPLVLHITERRRAEEKLIRANTFNETLIQTIPLGIDILDQQGRILYLNENLEKIVGKESVGKTCSTVYRSNVVCDRCPLSEPILEARTHSMEVDNVLGDKTFLIRYSGMTYENKEAILRVLEDITERKRLEEQLRQAQKMEAIGRLAGGVAHDFNNLLTAIRGYSELLLVRVGENHPLRKDIEKIYQAGDRASELTGQLLAFSRRQMLQPAVMDLNALVEDMQRLLNRLIGEDIELVTVLNPRLARVKTDAGQIGQVIMNLVLNARDAMPGGGKLTITTENVVFDQDASKRFPEAQPGKYVSLKVTDTGVGIPKEIASQIFEPFFSTKTQGKGTGLGLSVVYGIVKQHEGYVDVESEPGNGSNFIVYLPAVSDTTESGIKHPLSSKDLQGKGERILLVEDENEVRTFAARVLRENGYVVFEAENGKDALEIFAREKQVHFVFSDVVLPDRSGIQVVDEILRSRPDTRILFVSGYADHKSQWPAIRARGFDFLQKPYSISELLGAVRKAIEP
ncbi:MAG: ATP-binding protein [Pseudomonadota bacterium]